MKNEAIGAFEAACVMGLHWARPKKMADAGVLSCRIIGGGSSSQIAVYGLRQADQNWREYEELLRTGQVEGRPRAYEHMRPAALRVLGEKGRPQILFEDAIDIEEAARILRVFSTRVPRLIADGRLVARKLWSDRSSSPKLWIVSRHSAEKLCREIDKAEAAGKKRGRIRQPA